MMRRILGEPLLHFAVLGALLFALFRMLGDPRDTAPQRVVVTTGQIQRLAETWRRTWQRPPTRAELDGLVEEYVREGGEWRFASIATEWSYVAPYEEGWGEATGDFRARAARTD